MPFEKGRKKTGGRKKGSTNKDIQQIRDAFRMLVEDNLENMTKWLEDVAADSPKQALDTIQGLAEFSIPKLARTEITGEDGKDLLTKISVEIRGAKDKGE